MIENFADSRLETDIACKHEWGNIVIDGYEWGIRWCSVCGTYEYYTVQMDPLTTWTRGRRVPELARGFVNPGAGI